MSILRYSSLFRYISHIWNNKGDTRYVWYCWSRRHLWVLPVRHAADVSRSGHVRDGRRSFRQGVTASVTPEHLAPWWARACILRTQRRLQPILPRDVAVAHANRLAAELRPKHPANLRQVLGGMITVKLSTRKCRYHGGRAGHRTVKRVTSSRSRAEVVTERDLSPNIPDRSRTPQLGSSGSVRETVSSGRPYCEHQGRSSTSDHLEGVPPGCHTAAFYPLRR
jgi:hypothetical protein